jgi:hypothetical protein
MPIPQAAGMDTNASANVSENMEENYLPACFYSQMLSVLIPHRSISDPPSPSHEHCPQFFPKTATAAVEDENRVAHRLRTLARTQSRKTSEVFRTKRAAMFDGVESRAQLCAQELQEIIEFVRARNRCTAALKAQLEHSRTVSSLCSVFNKDS